MNNRRWNLLPPAPESFINASDFPPLIAQLLYNRGLTSPSQLELFLSADAPPDGDPFLLPDMHKAVPRIYQAMLAGESIAIYGDFDADGITATALLAQGLALLGGNPIPYIPHRLTEGYGLNTAALEKLRKQGISLVITVDCGVTAITEVEKAKRTGLDIIITDHHTPLPELPPAIAIVCPKLPLSSYPFSELSGAGVALKLLQALFQGIGKDEQANEFMDLAALGTVADMTPLLGENRYLVKQGLKLLNNTSRPGIREMIDLAGLTMGSLDAESISWVLAPRLNAAGRMAHALTSYKLLMTDSPHEARGMATWLEQKNTERQRMTAKALGKARESILAQGISPLLLASNEDYPAGIVGLVAGRLAEEFYRPSIVIRTGEQLSTGSCRSIPEFNIILALQKCQSLLSRFGGHSQAAGFTLPTKNLSRFQKLLSELAASQLEGADLRPHLDIDAQVVLPELSDGAFQMIQKLAPFGRGNPAPTFISRKVEVVDCRTMGNNGDHLRLKLRQGDTLWDAVAFRQGDCLSGITPSMDIVYNLEIDRWKGKETLRLNISDLAPSG